MDLATPLLGHDHPSRLRSLDDIDEVPAVGVDDLLEEIEREAAPDDRTCGEDLPGVVPEPLEAPSDDQAHALGNVELVDVDVRAELAAVEERAVLGEVVEHLLDE